MSKYIKPINDRIVVERIEETESAGGIVLPKIDRNAKRKNKLPTEFGKVLAVGPGQRLEDGTHCKMAVEVGDAVVYCCHVELPVILDGVEYVIIDEGSLIGVIKNDSLSD